MLLSTCHKYETDSPQIWVKALQLVVAELDFDEQMARKVVTEINRLELLGPLEIVQILSRNPKATLGLVRDFVVQKIVKERKEIEEVINGYMM